MINYFSLFQIKRISVPSFSLFVDKLDEKKLNVPKLKNLIIIK